MKTLGLSLEDAVDCATINPARVIHVDDRKGSIEIGKDADLLIVNEDLIINSVIKNSCSIT